MKEIKQIEQVVHSSSTNKTVIQKYINNPLLINKRKFDIRVFGLSQLMQGEYRGYFYKEGYIRTSSKEFSTDDIDNRFVHLTNDAIQKKASDYGKFEAGNKISYEDFAELLLKEKETDFEKTLLKQI